MRRILLTTIMLFGLIGMMAQSSSTAPCTLVVKTTDGNSQRFDLSEISEITFDNAPARVSTVTRVLNLSPDFISVSGVEENDNLIPGETATLKLTTGAILSNGFQSYHFEHLYVHINDQVISPKVPENYEPVNELTIPFTVPEEDCDIVVCYSIQQQLIDNGYTMTLEDNPNVGLYGVSQDMHYKYFDAYLLVNDAYTITDAEFKMGSGDWTSVNGTIGCQVVPDESVPNLYRVTIRPDYQNVTGDVVLRVSGEQHHRYNITWDNAVDEYLYLDKCFLPEGAIDGNTVTAELWVKEDYYLNTATASDQTEVETISRAYVRFTMPANDVTINLDILKKVPVTYVESEHVTEATFYDAKDIFYGVPTSIGIPGEEVYLLAIAEDGYKPATATTDDGHTFNFEYYAENMYFCPMTIAENAKSMSASVKCEAAYGITSEQEVWFNNGPIYMEGETVPFSIKVPDGYKVDKVEAKTKSGRNIDVTLDLPYGTLVMPAEDVIITVTYAELEVGNQVSVIAYYDEDAYRVNSSTNYNWNFIEGFKVDQGTTFYLSVLDFYGENFYVGVKVGDTVVTYPATLDEDMGEYSFGKSIVANGDVVIKVGPSEASVAF